MCSDSIPKRSSIVIIGPSQRFLSGISYFTLRLSNSLADHFNVRVLLFRNMLPKNLFPGWKRVGADLTEYKFRDDIRATEILDWYNPLTWLRGSTEAGKGDVIILQWWTSSVAHMYLAISIMNIKKRPVILEFHEVVDPLENAFIVLRIYSKIMGSVIRRLAACNVVHSENDRQLISSHYRIDLDKIHVIPHGIYDQYKKIDRNLAKDQLQIRESNIILFFGLLRPYKGVKYLIKAFEQLPDKLIEETRLLIVGEAWEDQESRDLVTKSPLSSHITLINRYVGDDEVPRYFSAADLLVLPYTRASQSGVAHIGMSFGIPIIATRVGGLEESLGKYRGSRFIEPMDFENLSDAIKMALSEKKIFEVPEELRWDVIAGMWDDLIIGLQKDKNA
jgi:glycosyltransferase involved in cell wall biosynthesis